MKLSVQRKYHTVTCALPADDVPWPVPLLPRLLPALGLLMMIMFAGLRDALAPEHEEDGRYVVPGFC